MAIARDVLQAPAGPFNGIFKVLTTTADCRLSHLPINFGNLLIGIGG